MIESTFSSDAADTEKEREGRERERRSEPLVVWLGTETCTADEKRMIRSNALRGGYLTEVGRYTVGEEEGRAGVPSAGPE